MTCLDAEVHVSALYDGETIPPEAAQHIAECALCHHVLNDYSTMGAEMRLAAAIHTAPLPSLPLPAKKNLWQFLKTGVRVPRFAVAGLVTCLAIATIAAITLRAQSRPLWFQFAYGLQKDPQFAYKVAQPGYEDEDEMLGVIIGSKLGGAQVRIHVENISFEDVALRIRAVSAKLNTTSKGTSLAPTDAPLSLAGVPVTNYKPGDDLAVPLEGGGTLYLKGKVFDHQPKIAFGLPLEPEAGELILRSPVLTSEGKLVGQSGASSSTGDNHGEGAVFFNTKEGKFTFGLKPFPRAVEAEANWGQINFKMADVAYRLVAAAPITGGDQPAKIWVRRDDADGPDEYIGSGPL